MAGTQAQNSLGAAWELELDPAGLGSSPVKGGLASESPQRWQGLKETTKTLVFFWAAHLVIQIQSVWDWGPEIFIF